MSLPALQDASGAFRPNVLTALIGETGAGKTTLMVHSHALPVQANPSSSVLWALMDGVVVHGEHVIIRFCRTCSPAARRLASSWATSGCRQVMCQTVYN
jgi:energy-coupling factor transporter ATP-binding protein EcfA2